MPAVVCAGTVIVGGDRRVHPPQLPWAAHPLPRTLPSLLEGPRTHAVEVVPELAALPVSRSWGGIMPWTTDGRPLIGRVPLSLSSSGSPGPGSPRTRNSSPHCCTSAADLGSSPAARDTHDGGKLDVFVVTGLASSGFMRGPMAGCLLAASALRLIDGDPKAASLLAGVGPQRFQGAP